MMVFRTMQGRVQSGFFKTVDDKGLMQGGIISENHPDVFSSQTIKCDR